MKVTALRATIVDKVSGAAHALNGGNALNANVVHSSRKALKQARAGLRLLKGATGKSFYVRQNAQLRDAARPLGRLRDEDALLEHVVALHKRLKRADARKLLAELRRQLVREKRNLRSRSRKSRETAKSAATVAAVAADLRRRSLSRTRKSVIFAGLMRIYRQGRKALKHASDGDDAALHEARKQVKYFHHALVLVFDARGKLSKLLDRSKDIGDWLGHDHDFALLTARVAAMQGPPEGRARVTTYLKGQRRNLQKAALKEGKRLYGHKPRKLAALFHAHA